MAKTAFQRCKTDLVDHTFTAFPAEFGKLRLICDASDSTVGAALEQILGNEWQPLTFFSRKFTPAQQKYVTYDRKLSAIHEAVRYFHRDFEGL